jgi:ribonucleoside-diphosphate reductase alpha chain
MRPASPFTDLAAVRAWDAWFRWRDATGLHDRTIESTWWRVARAAAACEGAFAGAWERRYFDALSRWRLLPDERVLRGAGTGVDDLGNGTPWRASVNVGAFVRSDSLDLEGIGDIAALAVRLLEGATAGASLRIGLIGVADALRQLAIPYDDIAAAKIAGDVAAALSRGARLGAEERGRDTAGLTGIAPQARLARLANNASDAVDPAPGDAASPLSQLRLRVAMQPWIDAPIDYPLIGDPGAPDADLAAFARSAGITLPPVRRAEPSSVDH